eukprot:762639-Hanusia_phi.AAC.3
MLVFQSPTGGPPLRPLPLPELLVRSCSFAGRRGGVRRRQDVYAGGATNFHQQLPIESEVRAAYTASSSSSLLCDGLARDPTAFNFEISVRQRAPVIHHLPHSLALPFPSPSPPLHLSLHLSPHPPSSISPSISPPISPPILPPPSLSPSSPPLFIPLPMVAASSCSRMPRRMLRT